MYRLRQKSARGSSQSESPADAGRLLRAQSIRNALLAAAIVIVVLNAAWVWLAGATGRFFPWFSLLQGASIGLAIQLAGRGLDWRFPVLAALTSILAAFSGNFFVSLQTTVINLETGPLEVLRGLTAWTWQTWYAEVLGPIDFVYALVAAAIAAYYSNRRLTRRQRFALRTMQQGER